ncbi:helix-turn-helix transcriptional regulator [Thiobacillus sedimenti]|uniref:LuxR C-terminal-related transcriptional regulator n=1 Tax=Thiobacillus sedimenti TaxID=3110231 RepID=A0ABZ1CP67_9PROT|nr:LuxR C-terminal-related transcriptional regulator [Thiobacillus sp. SCUT-2]WRS40107.1 LuxR C-terminal-related transcriptional regulator [Thiobacillus sp. SCUT-2]
MLDIISAIHGCALHPVHWHAALSRILDHLGARGGMLWSHQAIRGAFGLWVPCRLHPDWVAEYGRHYHQKDVWMEARVAQGCRAGDVLTGDMLVPRPAFAQSEFYRAFLKRFDYAQLLLGVVHHADHAGAVVPTVHISIFRGEEDKAFGAGDRKKLQDLLPHLQNATAVNFHLAERDQRLDIAQASIDLFTDALFFADRSGRVVYLNQAAQRLLAQDDGLRMLDERLTAANTAENRALQRLFGVKHSDEPTDPDVPSQSAALLSISRRSGRQGYLATRVQVTEDVATPDARRPHLVVLIHDPEVNTQGRVAALCARYALTAAESGVVKALLKTGSVRAAASHLRLSDNTIKTHLKSIFSKTGAHRQAELIRMVLSFPRL